MSSHNPDKPSSKSQIPSEEERQRAREAKGRTGSPQQSIPAKRQCQTCKRYFPRKELKNDHCQSCLTKHKIVELLIENDRQPDAKEVFLSCTLTI